MAPLLDVLKFASIPVVATIAAGALATFRDLAETFRSHVQHFAAGDRSR